jgi:hypothetical protein
MVAGTSSPQSLFDFVVVYHDNSPIMKKFTKIIEVIEPLLKLVPQNWDRLWRFIVFFAVLLGGAYLLEAF